MLWSWVACMYILIYCFNKYLLSASYMPGTVLSIGNTAVNKRDNNTPCLLEASILEEKTNKQDK